MKPRRTSHRPHRRFDHHMDRLQGATDLFDEQLEKAREQVAVAADHAREGLRKGRKAVVSLEQNVARAIRENPLLFLLAAVGLLSLVLAGRRLFRRRETPSLREEEAQREVQAWEGR